MVGKLPGTCNPPWARANDARTHAAVMLRRMFVNMAVGSVDLRNPWRVTIPEHRVEAAMSRTGLYPCGKAAIRGMSSGWDRGAEKKKGTEQGEPTVRAHPNSVMRVRGAPPRSVDGPPQGPLALFRADLSFIGP